MESTDKTTKLKDLYLSPEIEAQKKPGVLLRAARLRAELTIEELADKILLTHVFWKYNNKFQVVMRDNPDANIDELPADSLLTRDELITILTLCEDNVIYMCKRLAISVAATLVTDDRYFMIAWDEESLSSINKIKSNKCCQEHKSTTQE